MIKNRLLLALTLFISTLSFGQECDCSSNFKWLKKTFEQNDAGYQYAIDNKGLQAYKNHSKQYLKDATLINTKDECATLMREWTMFFRSNHVSIRVKQNENKNSTNNTNEIITNTNWEKTSIDINQFQEDVLCKKNLGFEGIWLSGSYLVGVKKVAEAYIGFIIESGATNWKKGHVKFKIFKESNHLKSMYYMGDHSKKISDDVRLINKNTLKMGTVNFDRMEGKLDKDAIELFITNKPLLKRLNANTLILRIPTFNSYAKKDIDNLILTNKKEILSTKNLIIDIRNNGGGSDGSYSQILPFIYTNPIRTIGVEYLSTKLNNQRMQGFIDRDYYKEWAKKSLEKLNANIGKFVNLSSSNSTFSTKVLDTVHKYPKNVGILINKGNGSTSEQFLLAAKQSKKVKLFGTTTYGVLDISNMYTIDFPSKQFTLGYSLSKSMRIPEMTIDEKGIQPDYYIDKSVPKNKWIEFVNNILNE